MGKETDDPPVDDRDVDSTLLEGFLLGWSVALQVHDIGRPSPQALRMIDLLREIADGRTTLVTTATEMAPQLPTNLVEGLLEHEGRSIARQRDIAGRIVRLLDRLSAG